MDEIELLEEVLEKVSLESSLAFDAMGDLDEVSGFIHENKGIDRAHGELLIRHCPSLESVPATSFTVYPTETNINVAVEGILDGLFGAVQTVMEAIFFLISALLKILVKPLEWIFGGDMDSSDSSGGGGGNGSGVPAKATDNNEKMEALVKDGAADNYEKAERTEKEKIVLALVGSGSARPKARAVILANMDILKLVNESATTIVFLVEAMKECADIAKGVTIDIFEGRGTKAKEDTERLAKHVESNMKVFGKQLNKWHSTAKELTVGSNVPFDGVSVEGLNELLTVLKEGFTSKGDAELDNDAILRLFDHVVKKRGTLIEKKVIDELRANEKEVGEVVDGADYEVEKNKIAGNPKNGNMGGKELKNSLNDSKAFIRMCSSYTTFVATVLRRSLADALALDKASVKVLTATKNLDSK